jgi:hypothetical protein
MATELPRRPRRDGFGKEEPNVGPVPGTRAFDGNRKLHRAGGVYKRRYILLPRTLVEVDGQKPTGVILEKRINASDNPATQMIQDDLIRDR